MGVDLTFDGGVANLVIEGPIDLEWAQALREHAQALAGRDDLRVVLLSARGRMFCPGGDIGWMTAQEDVGAAVHHLASTLHEGLEVLAALDAPVVAKVNGVAAGAGMSLVLGVDVAIAGSSAMFTMAYTGVGLSPDGGASWLLPRVVGRRAALDMMLSNRKVGAEEAAELGIVTRVVADDDLDAEVDAYVAQLASGPTAAYGTIKGLLAISSQQGFAEQMQAEADAIGALACSPTGIEGIAAFLEKRDPQFPAGQGDT